MKAMREKEKILFDGLPFYFDSQFCTIMICVLLLFLFSNIIIVIAFRFSLGSACSEKSACSIASGGSSIGGNSTATLGNDYPSLASDDFSTELYHDVEFTALDGNVLFFVFRFAHKFMFS